MSHRKWNSVQWLVLASLCGCQATTEREPFRLSNMVGGANRSASSHTVSAAPAESSGLFKSMTKSHAGTQPAALAAAGGNAAPGYMQRVSKPFQQVAHTVRDSLTIEPKMVPAVDATSLTQDPGPLQPAIYLAAARMMEQRGQLDDARIHYEKLLSSNPSDVNALVGIARLQHRQGQMDEAIQSYQKAIAIRGQDPVILNDLALCYGRAGRSDEAIQALKIAVVSSPDSLLYRNNLAAVLVESNRPTEAVEVLAEGRGPAIANYNVGYLLYQRGQLDVAQQYFGAALQADPQLRAAQVMMEKVQSGSTPIERTARPYDDPGHAAIEQAQPLEQPSVAVHQVPAAAWSNAADEEVPSSGPQLVSHIEGTNANDASAVQTAEFFALPMPPTKTSQKLRQPESVARPTRPGLIAPFPAKP